MEEVMEMSMPMTCVKTGCHVWLEEYHEWVYGDAFTDGNTLIIRAVARDNRPMRSEKHFTVHRIGQWWDKPGEFGHHKQPSTLVAHRWVNHGYDGALI